MTRGAITVTEATSGQDLGAAVSDAYSRALEHLPSSVRVVDVDVDIDPECELGSRDPVAFSVEVTVEAILLGVTP